MKCCSLKRKDLHFHFKRMSEKFYMLNGLNDPNLKHVFLASLPQELQPEIQRIITSTRRDVTQLSLGEFHQMTFASLDKLCEQQSFFKDLMDKKAILKKACSKSHLEIQCKKMCTCPSKLPRIKRGGKTRKKSLRFFKRRPFRKKKPDRCYLCGKKGHFARRCPNKKEKSAKMVSQILQISETTFDDTDIESLYSEQDEQTEDTVFAIHDISSDEKDEHSSVEERDNPQSYLPIYMMQANSTVEVTIPAPQVEIQILQSPYDKPIKAIGFIDTGATKTMLNPEGLPDDAWRTHYEYFQAADGQRDLTKVKTRQPWDLAAEKVINCRSVEGAIIRFRTDSVLALRNRGKHVGDFQACNISNHWPIPLSILHDHRKLIERSSIGHLRSPGESNDERPQWVPRIMPNARLRAKMGQRFSTSLITKKPIGIRFFPKCIIWMHVIGSKLHGRDLLIGFDLHHNAQKLQVLPTRLKYKRYFLPFSTIPRIFAITDAPAPYADIAKKLKQCCADSHADFKHPHPLWKNPEFFIQLPFKLNEDANPIKASHPGMTPDDLVLAREECNQLLALGLIEPTKSNWACPAFYVNKRTEKSEGKRGFWQLGIDPKDRYKTAFCLPNAQYQWTVMPFGLKSKPMEFVDGRYQPGPHITQELLKFPEENLTTKEIQQFLGIVNYIKDFIPECSRYRSQLSKLLKKEPPPWGPAQTMALQKLKQVCQKPLSLKIPGTGHRILQTYASNEFWGAILIEEENGKKHFCGHASGQFKDSEKYYHAVYKEILAIKYGIKKFEFHLIGHHFTVMMDNTSLPRIMDLKNKGVPEPQLLRLKDWFSEYQFTVKHIKGDANLIPDFLSRSLGIHLISPTGTISIFMASSSSSTSRSPLTFPPGFFDDLKNIREYALDNMFRYLARLILDTDIPPGQGCFRPDYPFLNVITLPGPGLPEDGLWFLWCLAALYYLPIEIRLAQMIDHLRDIKNGKSHIWIFLSWFDDIAAWNKQFQQTLDEGKSYSIIILHRPYYKVNTPWMRTYATVPSTLHQSRDERVWFGFESMPSTERPPRQVVPLGRGMGRRTLSQLNSLPTCSGEGYVGLPAALGEGWIGH
ncbi:polyprotein [Sesamum angolense]|uniref:Polyprotein n=1 Tax=Sesamum angolense TaxID=2727404 RepID=A0AAE1T0U2_9LAMI|nr:polyprotein [Sesamum angolense]